MLKWLIIVVLIVVISPFAFMSGFGLYYGLNVTNGLTWLVRSNTGYGLQVWEGPVLANHELERSYHPVVWTGDLDNEDLAETSGIAFSGYDDDRLYAVNDSGHDPILYAFARDGSDIAAWPLQYRTQHDIEDLASFTLDGEHFLLVADTGDNFYWRPELVITVFAEPGVGMASGTKLEPVWSFTFNFQQGYRDIEGVAVDASTDSILMISKRHIPPEVFRLPLQPESEHVTAEMIGRLTNIPQPDDRDEREDPDFGLWRSTPTAFDIRGRQAMVVTYKDIYLYQRGRREDWSEVISEMPIRIGLPPIHGLESGAFSKDGDSFFVTGERKDGRNRMGVFEVALD